MVWSILLGDLGVPVILVTLKVSICWIDARYNMSQLWHSHVIELDSSDVLQWWVPVCRGQIAGAFYGLSSIDERRLAPSSRVFPLLPSLCSDDPWWSALNQLVGYLVFGKLVEVTWNDMKWPLSWNNVEAASIKWFEFHIFGHDTTTFREFLLPYHSAAAVFPPTRTDYGWFPFQFEFVHLPASRLFKSAEQMGS